MKTTGKKQTAKNIEQDFTKIPESLKAISCLSCDQDLDLSKLKPSVDFSKLSWKTKTRWEIIREDAVKLWQFLIRRTNENV